MTARHIGSEALRAALPAATFSGIPSTLHACATRGDPLEAAVAAGSILLPNERRRGRLLLAAAAVHVSISVAWSLVLAVLLPRKNPIVEGTAAGLLIASIDLGLIGRRSPLIRALDPVPQVADHIAFGIIAARMLSQKE